MNRFDLSRLNAIVAPLLAGGLGLLVGAVVLLALGANPLDACAAMGQSANAPCPQSANAGSRRSKMTVLS